MASFSRLAAKADLILVEGAGSPAEINLRAGDIANMGFAERAGVPVVLVGDIDRGGVIASIVGTHAVLATADRVRIAGYVINKFRGDVSLFADGMEEIERRYVSLVLEASGGNKTLAAQILGFDRKTLYRKLERYEARAQQLAWSAKSDLPAEAPSQRKPGQDT